MKYSKKMFNKISEERMTSIVLKACENRLGNQSPECQAIAKVFLPPVFKFLRTMNPDAFCAHLKHCTLVGSTKLEVPVFAKANDDLTCDFCKQLVEHLRQILASNATQEELKEAFLNFCEELGSAAEECQKLLDEYFDMAYSYLLEALTPDEFCAAIGLCQQTSRGGMNSQEKAMNKVIMKLFPSSEQQKKHLLKLKLKKYGKVGPSYKSVKSIPLVKVVPALPAKYLEANTSAALPMVKLFPSQETKAGDIITCSLCKSLINLAEQLLPGNMTVEAIAELLDYICDLFPGSERQQCKAFIDTNRDIIIKFLAEDAAPEVICHMITLCSAPPAAKVSPYSDCDFCQDIVQFLYSELKNNSTEEELRQLLEGVCRLFPGESGKKCLGVVDTYFNLVMSMILQEFTPDQICKQLGFCPSSKQAPSSIHAISQPTKQVVKKKISDSECDMCVSVVQFVYSELKNNATEEEIKLLLDKACSLLPGSSKQKCIDMVNNYLDMLVELIIQQLTPNEICQTLGFCPSSIAASPVVTSASHFPKQGVPKATFGGECDICKNIVQFVYNEMKDKSSEDEVKKLLDGVCNLFAEAERQECVNLVNTYLDVLVPMLLNKYTPTQICQSLHLCPIARATSLPSAPKNLPPKKVVDPNPECAFCQSLVKLVYDELEG
uniref:Pulmonary surfactant-associated protein B n=1 Tax=Ixodes ricinus TaxID=34613 RepID=V5H0Q3_IXORI